MRLLIQVVFASVRILEYCAPLGKPAFDFVPVLDTTCSESKYFLSLARPSLLFIGYVMHLLCLLLHRSNLRSLLRRADDRSIDLIHKLMQVYAGLLLLVISDITVVGGVLSGRLLRAGDPILVVERVHTVHVGCHVR